MLYRAARCRIYIFRRDFGRVAQDRAHPPMFEQGRL